MSVKDLEKFVRHFVLKCVQVIVQSRLGSKTIKTQSNPKGNDWFNLAISDIKDINEQTKKCLESIGEQIDSNQKQINSSLITIKNDWKICCEISMKTTEGNSMTLEYWFVSNESNTPNEDQSALQSQPQSSPTLIIYNLYNKMSLMLKSLISVTRATPAYKLSQKGQSADSYIICYRVYRCDSESNILTNEEESQHFSSIKQLGSIRSAFNELFISFIYRTDLSTDSKAVNENITINSSSVPKSPQLLPVKNDHFQKVDRLHTTEERNLNKPLKAAFASSTETNSEHLLLIPDSPFSTLIQSEDTIDTSKSKTTAISPNSPKTHLKSEPIIIPIQSPLEQSIASSPIYSSSGDSFVFVELKAPFASQESHELGSFFNGPSPTFTGSGVESSGDLSELTVTLAEMESNAQQFDNFVESICLTQNEEESKETE